MKTRKYENRIQAKFNEVAEIIRKHGKIKFGDLCAEAHLAPSTLYQYWRAMRDRYKDLHYEAGVFFVVRERHHRLPNGKLVPVET